MLLFNSTENVPQIIKRYGIYYYIALISMWVLTDNILAWT
jgi:protein associated with RNAse G/E